MIKYISANITDDKDKNEEIIIKGILRNFGGTNFEVIIQTLEEKMRLRNIESIRKTKVD